jgi:hypothetical protein
MRVTTDSPIRGSCKSFRITITDASCQATRAIGFERKGKTLLPCEAVRVAKKVLPWLDRRPEQRVAVQTLIDLVETAHADVQREQLAAFARLLDQLEEPA